MIDLNRIDLEYLLFLDPKGQYARVQELLGNPFALEGRLSSQSAPDESRAALKQFRDSGDPKLRRFFDLHLITRFLLFKDDEPEWLRTWLVQEMEPDLHFPGMTWEQVLRAEWISVPVLVVYDKARVVYFIAGLLSATGDRRLWPRWADGIMDNECRSAVEAAASEAESTFPLAEDKSLFCFPLLVPGETTQIRGLSLGLSLALGFLSLAGNKTLSRHLVASGALAGTCGSIGEVESLEKKAQCAERRGFRVFLYPSSATPPSIFPSLESLPVADLGEAWMFAQLYAPGKSRDLILLSKMLKSPEVFVNNVDLVEPEWLDWVRREGKAEELLGLICRETKWASVFVDKMEWALNHWKLDLARAMAGLVSPSRLASMASGSALTALRLCTQNMALANHRGDVTAALSWVEEGEPVSEEALKADINACADFLNNLFIVRHNRYEFSPGFPDGLKSVLECLERRHAVQCSGGCMVDRALGELYGSICQNFGFCSPRCLSDCESYAQKAVEAFGGENIPETRDAVLRQYSYLAYARLDASEHESAKAALFRFLEMDDWGQLPGLLDKQGLSRWQHALLARFLADTPDAPQKRQYLEWALGQRSEIMDQHHPWQLWLHNLGRIGVALDRKKEAEGLFQESRSLCLKENLGPTVHVMALLPLSGMLKLGRLSAVDVTGAMGQVSASAESLNLGHFRVLREKASEGVLRDVWESPERLFPFSYR